MADLQAGRINENIRIQKFLDGKIRAQVEKQ
jgi:hypothetical protein